MKADDLNLMVDFATELANSGFNANEVDEQLKKQGSSLNEVGAVMQYGADNILKSRQAIETAKEQMPSHTSEIAKEAVWGGLKGLGVGLEQALSGGTFGGYDWATKKLAEATGVPEISSELRRKQFTDKVSDQSDILGDITKGALITTDIASAISSPVSKAIAAAKLPFVSSNKYAQKALDLATSGLTGAGLGGLSAGFRSDFDKDAVKQGAGFGGLLGVALPVGVETTAGAINLGGRAIRRLGSVGKKAIKKIPGLNIFTKDADEIAEGAEKISGMKPDIATTGSAVRRLAEEAQADINRHSKELYDEAERIAGNPKIFMGKKSNLYQEIQDLSGNTTKSGQRELEGIWSEIEHTKKNAPTYNALKTLRSDLSSRSAKATGTLTENQYGRLVKAVEKDMESGIGSEAKVVFDEAKSFYANEMNNPNSTTNSVNKLLGKSRNVSDSELGNRAISSAQGKAWKATPLNNLLKAGSAENVDAVKRGIQANTTTVAQFNRMTPEQKIMVYGDKLPEAVKNFKGGLDYKVEDIANKLGEFLRNRASKINYNPRILPGILEATGE